MSSYVKPPEPPEPPPYEELPMIDPPPPGEKVNGSFALIIVALLVLAGGAVYAIGAFSSAEKETAEAEASANDQLKQFDPNEFSSEFDETPDSLPLTEGDPGKLLDSSDESASSTDDADAMPSEDQEPSGPHPGIEINPGDIAMAFINRVPGDDYGKVGYLTVDAERFQTELSCARMDLNAFGGLCLTDDNDITGSARGLITDAALVPEKTFGLNSPSRAAVSPDGSVVAWTGFTLGHSYLDEGEFATITQLISVERRLGANLETAFDTYKDDEPYYDGTRNYWGVTFVDNDLFYATMGSSGTTYLVSGRVSDARIDVVFDNATCPEVSPDGSTLVAKERREGDFFQLIAIDTETGERRDLGENRSVEDQVEFLDDDTVVYALPNPDEGTEAQPVFDVWALDLTPGAEPRLIVPFADSPAV